MTLTAAVQSLASVSLFTSRAFLPAFALAVLARFGPQLPLLRDVPLIRDLGAPGALPAWFTEDVTIVLLAVLAVLEMLADKDPDLKQFMLTFDKYAKAAMSALVTLGLATAVQQREAPDSALASFGAKATAAAAACGVYAACLLRASILGYILDLDDDGTLGLVKLVSIAEDAWAFFGLALLILFPSVVLVLAGLVLLLLFAARKAIERIDERSKTQCPACGAANYRCAPQCAKCGGAMPQPRGVGLLGRTLKTPAADPKRHACALIENRRCPFCAARLPARATRQKCPACARETIPDHLYQDYMAMIRRRLPVTLVVCFGLSMIPIIGAPPGVIYYRLRLAAPFRRYLPGPQRIFLRWVVGFVSFFLLAFQWVPIVGSLSIPSMALVNYWFYSRAYARAAGRETI